MSWHFACSLSISPRASQRPEMCRRQGRDMSLVKRVIAALLLTGAAALLLASSTLAQERVGVVTTIEGIATVRSEEHTSELQSPCNLVCRLLLEKKKKKKIKNKQHKKKKKKTIKIIKKKKK